MKPLETFYTDDPGWHEKIGGIHALIERVKISEERAGDLLRLRKLSRILSIHASTAIEGNRSFMLDAIANSFYKYMDAATETTEDVGVNVGVNEQVLDFLRRQPNLSARELAALRNKSTRTVERYLKELREQGRLRRVGSDKAGRWEVIGR